MDLCLDKQNVMDVEEFYRMIKEEGQIDLSQAQKNRIRKIYINIKDNTLPYSTVLKNLEYSGESNEW